MTIEQFETIWHAGKLGREHTPEIWNERASEWFDEFGSDGTASAIENAKIASVTDFLISRGALTADSEVIDIGCGPGLYALEFAKTAKHVVAVDFSTRFIDFAEDLAKRRGVTNVDFVCAKFPDGLSFADYERKFDLAFASCSPAVGSPENIRIFERLSRNFCCNFTFARAEDRDGSGLFALWNIMWLEGKFPEVSYFDEPAVKFGNVLWRVGNNN
jgi:SAM-dependent methyltransferase